MKSPSQIGKMSRAKGARVEREIVTLLQNAGIPAKRTAPLQTNRANEAPDILASPLNGVEISIEVKARAKGSQFHNWLNEADALVYRVNKKPPLVVLPFDTWLKLIGGNQ